MDINPTVPTAGAAARSPATPTTGPLSNPNGKDFQTFLTLLVAQMRNQDPLKPAESTEFVAQLATFSGVEQQVKMNEKLDLIFAAMLGGGASAAGLAEWIGREVRAPVPASFTGVPVEVEVAPHAEADGGFFVVRNTFDQVVLRAPINPGQTKVTWDGTTTTGEQAAHGTYRFEIESRKGDTLLSTQPGQVFASVAEVRIEEGGPKLVLASGETLPVSAVTAVR